MPLSIFVYFYIHVGKTVNRNCPPSSADPMYEEVGVAGEAKSSQEIQLNFNEAYGPVVKGSIQILPMDK